MKKFSFYSILLLILVLMIVGVVDSQSQPISRKSNEPDQSRNKQTETANPNPKNLPASTVTNVPNKTEESTTKKENYGKQNKPFDCFPWLVSFIKGRWYEISLTLFTFFVALFTGLLYRATAGLWNVAKQQSKNIKQSVEIAQQTAEAAKIQAEVMQQEFALKQRAKIHVRDIVITNLIDLTFPEGTLNIINTGGTPAKIINIGSWFEIGYGKQLPMERPDEAESPNLPNPRPIRLEAGGPAVTYSFIDNRRQMSSNSYDSIRAGKNDCTLYAMGYIEYVDTTRNTRRTTFFREYRLPKDRIGGHKEERRFFPVERYEYEE